MPPPLPSRAATPRIPRCGKEVAQRQRHCTGAAAGAAGERPAGKRSSLDRGHHPRFRQRPDDCRGLWDLLDPRGGRADPRLRENAKVPCIQTGTGICHIFVDDTADQAKALDIIENAKASRPSVCNAEEVCLVHSAIAQEFLPGSRSVLAPTALLRASCR